ncbi:HAD family hydrolase [Bailinhaonella thermotolerans]|uniref:HAD family hydrolase n=1 Tax=Bailinhaonella thermotolerans TaxID=1070861 RepID=A0A3A4APS6_9ACTN|nr:HAD family hydrolase [Bailinhaonella thermotolerans]RJL30435.1 HAD family hydrolase [Bailinhaonella thermotolerans]
MKHIVWDWNGTLFHDIDAVVDATNEVFRPYGLSPMDAAGFRAVYSRPIWACYERLLGRALAEGEWEALDRSFHDNYHRLMLTCDLAEGVREGLKRWDETGGSQSLLSMWRHERLVPAVAEFGIAPHFRRVDGLREAESGGHKARYMAAHVQALGVDPATVTVIGDSVDDADAAVHVGARAILYTGGMTTRRDLEATGFPVVDSLAEALDLA